jgi:hypothetical protein
MIKLFISHASEDKDGFVRPLAERLKTDFEVWYDEYELTIGDKLREKIDQGLRQCDYGVVVLSPHFFAKRWPQEELDGLFSLETKERKVILPVWKDVTAEDVRSFSPILASRLAVSTDRGIDRVVNEIKKAVGRPSQAFGDNLPHPDQEANRIPENLRLSIQEADLSLKIQGSYLQNGKAIKHFLVLDNKGADIPHVVKLETWEPSKRWNIAFDHQTVKLIGWNGVHGTNNSEENPRHNINKLKTQEDGSRVGTIMMDTNWSENTGPEYLTYRFTCCGQIVSEGKTLIP